MASPEEPGANPFAEIGKDPASRAPVPMSRREITRKVIAGLVFLIGIIVMTVGIVLSMAADKEYQGGLTKTSVVAGLAIFSVAYAIYDGRWTGGK